MSDSASTTPNNLDQLDNLDNRGEDRESTTDVVIVGAGPAGIAAAVHLHWQGRSVVVVDKAVFPRDKCCGDGLTALALRELEELQFYPPTVPSWYRLDGALLSSPSGKQVEIPLPSGDGEYAAVAPRLELDDALVRHARSIGIAVVEGTEIIDIAQAHDHVAVTVGSTGGAAADRSTIRSRYLIAADGAWSPTRKLVGAGPENYRGEWQAMRQYVEGVTGIAASKMLIWFEPELLPGYAWSFPLPDGRANFGFGVLRSAGHSGAEVNALWTTLLARPHLRDAFGPAATMVGRRTAWPIPANIDAATLSDHRVIFVGDAAAASDVLTGEGIGQALLTGRLAAESIKRGGSDHASAVTSHYHHRVERELMPDHRMSARLGAILSTADGVERALGIIDGSGEWGRRNFARWLFEDEPRAIVLTPSRWHRRFLARSGAYKNAAPGR